MFYDAQKVTAEEQKTDIKKMEEVFEEMKEKEHAERE